MSFTTDAPVPRGLNKLWQSGKAVILLLCAAAFIDGATEMLKFVAHGDKTDLRFYLEDHIGSDWGTNLMLLIGCCFLLFLGILLFEYLRSQISLMASTAVLIVSVVLLGHLNPGYTFCLIAKSWNHITIFK
jgi:hypothetical protein